MSKSSKVYAYVLILVRLVLATEVVFSIRNAHADRSEQFVLAFTAWLGGLVTYALLDLFRNWRLKRRR